MLLHFIYYATLNNAGDAVPPLASPVIGCEASLWRCHHQSPYGHIPVVNLFIDCLCVFVCVCLYVCACVILHLFERVEADGVRKEIAFV